MADAAMLELGEGTGFSDAMGVTNRSGVYRVVFKRVLDIVGSALALILFAPLIALLAVFTALDGGSAFFGHNRVGRNGRIFRCWKLRSMVVDAEAALEKHLAANPAAAAEWASERKLRDDPRITRFGAFLRRSSLDELPQLWNVLRGEMSLVGPRPVTKSELELYGAYTDAYLSERPGVTGLWQVSGRNDTSYSERVKLDAKYTRELSFPLDIMICLRTLRCVTKGDGC